MNAENYANYKRERLKSANEYYEAELESHSQRLKKIENTIGCLAWIGAIFLGACLFIYIMRTI